MLKKVNKNRNKSGSALVAVLLVLFMLSVVATALIKRSLVSLSVTKETRQSNDAYQESDEWAEKILTGIRKLDESAKARISEETPVKDVSIIDLCNCLTNPADSYCINLPELNNKFIPLASPNQNFCLLYDIGFYDKNDDLIPETEFDYWNTNIGRVSKIKVNSYNTQSSVRRSVEVNIPQRIQAPFADGIAPTLCTLTTNPPCPTGWSTSCGAKCYRFEFPYDPGLLLAGKEAFSGARIIKKVAATDWKSYLINDITETDNDVSKIFCNTDFGRCHFYLGNLTSPANAIDGTISFRLVSNVNYKLDSMNHTFCTTRDLSTGDCTSETIFDFSP